MTTFLYNLMVLPLQTGAQKMAQPDPHGLTLTFISIGVVFLALIILYCIYSLSGSIFSGKFKRKPSRKASKASSRPSDEEAAAIAMALDLYSGGDEVGAAIATALHLYLSGGVHDVESGVITFSGQTSSPWEDKRLNFRKTPSRK